MLPGTHFPRFRHFQFFLFFVFQRVNTPDALKQRFRWRSVLHETAPAILRRTQDRTPLTDAGIFHPGKTDPLAMPVFPTRQDRPPRDAGISHPSRQDSSPMPAFHPGKTELLTDTRISPRQDRPPRDAAACRRRRKDDVKREKQQAIYNKK
jgi:hypothetical protein